ncbi:phosphate acetyltransferase [Candidatus Vecturithrix granuli]|uniref:Phosphate acetyltransferase n=1 Tax=Vecturithrix granuli TaxID=1499967 RepID=A0A081C7E1_VECG1|nr:phosphate acetyltransferase [Candidatus Vecturithrix granuli]
MHDQGGKDVSVIQRTTHNVQRTSYPHIVKIDGVCGGQAIINGMRIAVWHLVGYYYRVGMSVEEIVAEWNYLTPAQVFSALAYYHDHKAEIDAVRQQNSYEHWQQEYAHAA